MKTPCLYSDDKLNFKMHIRNICKSTVNQLNVLVRLKKLLNFEEKKILINSYFIANFYYCPLVWILSNASSSLRNRKFTEKSTKVLM